MAVGSNVDLTFAMKVATVQETITVSGADQQNLSPRILRFGVRVGF